MRINVMMLAHQLESQIYPLDVTLTADQLTSLVNFMTKPADDDSIVQQVLDKVYCAGNREDRPHGRLFCSVSCGDVALLGDWFYLLSRNGWKRLTVEEMARYCAMDRRDRMFCDLMN